MLLIALLVIAVVVGLVIARIAGISGAGALGPPAAMAVSVLVFWGLVDLL